jgi:CubicO group peptidase (beta-lactamase class C family)
MNVSQLEAVAGLFEQAVADQTLPGAVLGVANPTEVLWRAHVGYRQMNPELLPMTDETLFDLASLTKVIATTSITLRFLEQGRLRIDDPVEHFLAGSFGDVRLWHLLTHTSGFPAWLDLTAFGRDETVERIKAIAEAPRLYDPGDRVLYSDVNFVLLGHVLEHIAGQPLDRLFQQEVAEPLGMTSAGFLPASAANIAATEINSATGKPWIGVVHDENARGAGGVLGHAGLFGTLDDLLTFGQALLRYGQGAHGQWLSRATVEALICPRTNGLSGELRAFGYQKPHRLSSAGDLMSARAIGHTGFTGTSLWIDFEYAVVMVALTNRVHLGRQLNAPIRLRPIFHNMVLAAL